MNDKPKKKRATRKRTGDTLHFEKWLPIVQRQEASFCTPQEALTLPPYYNALRLLQKHLGLPPLLTYRVRSGGGRDRAEDDPAFNILNKKWNPAQDRQKSMALLAYRLFHEGEYFAQIRRKEGKLYAIHPIPKQCVRNVRIDENLESKV